MQQLFKQINLFLLALGFFSRIPVAGLTQYSEEKLNQANRYFGLVGWLLGILVAIVFVVSSMVFDKSIALFLAMVASLLLTGAFHEDGLADMADGFGGGFSTDRKLSIMKDSRLGTYGSCALILTLFGKYLTLIQMDDIVIALIVAYPLSRVVAASLIFELPYVSDLENSKSKPLASRQSLFDLFVLVFSGVVTLVFVSLTQAIGLIMTLLVFRAWFKRFLLKQIGGFTGDCLGGAQQISELLIYLVLVASWSN